MAYALAARLERAVKNAGVKYKKVSGWSSRGHGTMGSIQSVIVHHTAGPKSGNSPSLNVVAYGRPGLSGPLAQLFLARDGTVYLVAAGVSYHAGRVNNSNFTNSHALGIEAENTGLSNDSPWPAHQVDAYAKLCKALCDEFGLSTSRVRGHKEVCSPRGRKIDPTLNMSQFRKKVGGAKGGVSSGGGTSGGSSRTYKTVAYGKTLGKYDKGDPVKDWQDFLVSQGHKLKVDGYFGNDTVKATRSYQKKAGVDVDGMAGTDTISKAAKDGFKWKRKPKAGSKPKTPDAPKFPFPKGHWMGVESSNPKNHSGYHARDRAGIKVWQSRMKARGWTITVDGRFGPQSERVARQFQKQVKVAQDGLVGEVTFEKSWTAPVT